MPDVARAGRSTLLELGRRSLGLGTAFGGPAAHVAICFTVPAAVIVWALAWAYIRFGRLPEVAGLLYAHLLVGHEGSVDCVAVSPDGRWVATSGEDNTLRLWPMPDLSNPPLHTLPHDELLAKLHPLTNLRVVRAPESPAGWRIEVGPFPGWKDVPTW